MVQVGSKNIERCHGFLFSCFVYSQLCLSHMWMVATFATLLLGQLFCFYICYHKLLRNIRNLKVVSVSLS